MVPRFLVIGAMKAGTTTLYEDLRSHPGIFLPEKELDSLGEGTGRNATASDRYERLFRRASSAQLLGEVSATYAKLPESSGVVARAAETLGDDFRVLYILRNPIERLMSHHHHAVARRLMPGSVDEAVDRHPELLSYSRYGMQLRPWIELVGRRNVILVQFERYMSERRAGLAEVIDFLGLPHIEGASLDRAHNVSAGARAPVGRLAAISRSWMYRKAIRPLLPAGRRRQLGNLLLPRAPDRPDPPAPGTMNRIIPELVRDQELLIELWGDSSPVWDLDATRARYVIRN